MANREPSDAQSAAGNTRSRDDYITSPEAERKLGLPVDETAEQIAAEGELSVTPDEVLHAENALHSLDWRHGLTRDEIKAAYPELPVGIYLRLPATKKFTSPLEALHECGLAPSRAEGMFMGANPEVEFPEEESVDEGGPPGWGDQPAVYPLGATIEGGSAEDTEGLLPGEAAQGGEPESASQVDPPSGT
ncbi:MAG TPA: hypothetical protein VFU88_03090 [Ktedonobacterales bacterium]|nr:hypothetical protein [Ktedonobacterales bacterium]